MNKQLNFSVREIVILLIVQVFVIRYVAVPIVKKALVDVFEKKYIMCEYDESKSSEER